MITGSTSGTYHVQVRKYFQDWRRIIISSLCQIQRWLNAGDSRKWKLATLDMPPKEDSFEEIDWLKGTLELEVLAYRHTLKVVYKTYEEVERELWSLQTAMKLIRDKGR